TVDAYCAQHSGDQDDRRARQSANIHLIALYLTFEKKASAEEVLKFLQKATTLKRNWPPLRQRTHPQWLTIHDVLKAKDAMTHCAVVNHWGQSVWEAYADCHKDLIMLYEKLMEGA